MTINVIYVKKLNYFQNKWFYLMNATFTVIFEWFLINFLVYVFDPNSKIDVVEYTNISMPSDF